MFISSKRSNTVRFGIIVWYPWTVCAIASEPEPPLLTLDHAARLAIVNDPWLDNSRHSEKALTAESISASALPDPEITVAVANLPTNTFDFQQEAMTQFAVGVSQMFPRGDGLKLKKKQLPSRQSAPLPSAESGSERLLQQLHEQAELSLSAYTHDRGSFAEVVQARIAELNGEIDALAIDIEKQKLIAQINYFLPGPDIIEEAP